MDEDEDDDDDDDDETGDDEYEVECIRDHKRVTKDDIVSTLTSAEPSSIEVSWLTHLSSVQYQRFAVGDAVLDQVEGLEGVGQHMGAREPHPAQHCRRVLEEAAVQVSAQEVERVTKAEEGRRLERR